MAAVIPLDPYTLSLLTIVCVFWLLVIQKARAVGRAWFPNLLILPLFFIGLGLWINRARPPWGTYIVGGVHVLLLIMLAVKLSTARRK
jgi:hypothetical protein